jgi:hypothetical protein
MRSLIGLFLLISLFFQTFPVWPQALGRDRVSIKADLPSAERYMRPELFDDVIRQMLTKIFAGGAASAIATLNAGAEELIDSAVSETAARAEQSLNSLIEQRKEKQKVKPQTSPVTVPGSKTRPSGIKPSGRGFTLPRDTWRQMIFAFQPYSQQSPDIKITETDKEIKAAGRDKKSFETKEASGTRTQKVETKYVKNGKIFGVEIKNIEVIEAVSKSDGKRFRRELSMTWGADVVACPNQNGVTTGIGKAKVTSKTTYTEGEAPIVMTSDFDLEAKMTGYVGDDAMMQHYDMQVDAFTTNSGYEQALIQNLIKEIKIKDGRYGLQYDMRGNTLEVSDGRYGGTRTPAKIGRSSVTPLSPMSDAGAKLVESAISKMIPSIWNSANEMYSSAQKNWRKGGCVEVVCKVPTTTLKPRAEISVSAETVHLQDAGKVDARMTAEAYNARITPETQQARPAAVFRLTQEGDEKAFLGLESVSKRGIGKADIEFELEKEKTAAGRWAGTIKVERRHKEEREKRSGSNLAENGGHIETITSIQVELTGDLDRSVEAANAYIANLSGEQRLIDHEYDRYKIDEGYCGPNAVPYKGPKEITRTSTTTVNYGAKARVFLEIAGASGSASFSLPEINGTTLHKYLHKSPCSEHDRVNTNEAVDEDVPTTGGSFSVSFPVDPSQKKVAGTATVRGEDGSITTYKWELTRQ